VSDIVKEASIERVRNKIFFLRDSVSSIQTINKVSEIPRKSAPL
jgi:hypothetical protein